MDPWRIDDFAHALTSLSDNTVAAYRSDVQSFADWCARSELLDPGAVTRTTIRRYLAHLTTRQFARRSIARKIAAIRRYYRWLLSNGVVQVDPTSGVSVPAGDGRLPRVLDQRELSGLLDAPADEHEPVWRRTRDDAVLELLYGSGLRVGELCGLTVSSVSVADGVAHVWGKGSKERRVPISEPAFVAQVRVGVRVLGVSVASVSSKRATPKSRTL